MFSKEEKERKRKFDLNPCIFQTFFSFFFFPLSHLPKPLLSPHTHPHTKTHKRSTAKPNKYSAKELRLMRTQDVRHVAARATHELRAAERMARSLHGIGAVDRSSASSHVVFVDSAPQVKRFDPVRHFGTPKELLDRHYNRPRLLPGSENDGEGGGGGGGGSKASSAPPLVAFPRGVRPDRAAMNADRQRLASYAELARVKRRAAKLAGLEGAMRKAQALSGKGRVRRLSAAEVLSATNGASDGRGVKGKVYKWAKVRKR